MSDRIKRSELEKRKDVISLNFYIMKEFYKRIDGNKLPDLYSALGITRNGFVDIIRFAIVTRLLKEKDLTDGTYNIDTKPKVLDLFDKTGLEEAVFTGKLDLKQLLKPYNNEKDIEGVDYPDEYKILNPLIEKAIIDYREKDITDLKKNNQLDCLYYYCKFKRRLNEPNLHFEVLKRFLTEKISNRDFIECDDKTLLKDLEVELKKVLAKTQATLIYRNIEESDMG